jgi:hypothetical protein
LLSAPQAFFGLALNGWVLKIVIVIITMGAWVTVIQRIAYVYNQTRDRAAAEPLKIPVERAAALAADEQRSARR